jgi:hypothetical protein
MAQNYFISWYAHTKMKKNKEPEQEICLQWDYIA